MDAHSHTDLKLWRLHFLLAHYVHFFVLSNNWSDCIDAHIPDWSFQTVYNFHAVYDYPAVYGYDEVYDYQAVYIFQAESDCQAVYDYQATIRQYRPF